MPPVRKYTSQGFSLAETIVALSVLTFVLLALAGLFMSLLRAGEKSSNTATGKIFAQQITTEKLGEIYASSALKDQFFGQDSPPAEPITGTVTLGSTQYSFEIRHQTILDGDGNAVGGDNNHLKKIDTTVWWWNEKASDERAGYGKLVVYTTRLISEKTAPQP